MQGFQLKAPETYHRDRDKFYSSEGGSPSKNTNELPKQLDNGEAKKEVTSLRLKHEIVCNAIIISLR